MRSFDYASPTRLDQAFALLGQDGDGDIRPLAGGTDLLTLMKADVAAPSRLINIKRLPGLDDLRYEEGVGLRLGALTTLAVVETSDLVRQRYPMLAEAAAVAATPQLRNMATVGGNLLQRPRCWYFRNHRFPCWLKGGDECPARDGENQLHAIVHFGEGPCVAVHPSDLAPALVALDAEVRLLRQGGERTLPLAEFLQPPVEARRTETVLEPGELLVSIRVPPPPAGAHGTYLKAMERGVWAFALVSVAAMLSLDGRRVADARLVLGGVAAVPWRVTAAEDVLRGATAGDELFARAAEAALADARALGENAYKVPLAKALIRRALASLVAGRG